MLVGNMAMRGAMWSALLIVSTATVSAFPASAEGVRLQPDGGNLAVVVFGGMDGVEPERFARSVVAAMPEELFDPDRNFTRHPAYQPQRDYTVVMSFHDPAQPVETDLCKAGSRSDAAPPPPDFRGLHSAVGLTGALCVDDVALRTTTAQSAGRVTPDQLSFRFLIADAAKALFPDGFARLPRTTTGAP